MRTREDREGKGHGLLKNAGLEKMLALRRNARKFQNVVKQVVLFYVYRSGRMVPKDCSVSLHVNYCKLYEIEENTYSSSMVRQSGGAAT